MMVVGMTSPAQTETNVCDSFDAGLTLQGYCEPRRARRAVAIKMPRAIEKGGYNGNTMGTSGWWLCDVGDESKKVWATLLDVATIGGVPVPATVQSHSRSLA
ncbi:hypothetical protein V1477_015001 [Vespula maculifrons]|uniref:Uncharacterized protein n=2 Tax=Vespula TaxID=7451 RepID=A0A834JIP5_VESVU|nr:hypothetical protein HZH66_010126 [Vespula vulgaris]